jgi:hypothetical protein
LAENPFDLPFVFDLISRDLSDTEVLAKRLVGPEAAAKWVNDRGDAWIEQRLPSYH